MLTDHSAGGNLLATNINGALHLREAVIKAHSAVIVVVIRQEMR
jgi:hypothetical protein